MNGIFKFDDYRKIIQEFISNQPNGGWGQVKLIADSLDLQPPMISQILGGTKVLSIDHAIRLAEYMGLAEIEVDYFVLLVQQESAVNHKAKAFFAKKISLLKESSRSLAKRIPKDKTLSDSDKSVFYSDWAFAAIRIFCSLDGGKDVKAICRRFGFSESEVVRKVDFMVRAGLLKKDNHKYYIGTQKTHLERTSPMIKRHWTNWRLQALRNIDLMSDEDVFYSAPFSISKKDFEVLREQITQMIKTTVQTVQETDAEEVACVNFDLFWLR